MIAEIKRISEREDGIHVKYTVEGVKQLFIMKNGDTLDDLNQAAMQFKEARDKVKQKESLKTLKDSLMHLVGKKIDLSKGEKFK